MTDEGRMGGFTTAGQSVKETAGGWGEILIAVRITVLLMFLTGVSTFYVVVVTMLVGPWSLVFGAPWAFERVLMLASRWLWNDETPVSRPSLLSIGALVAGILVFLPDAALVWWPWPWQAHHETWLGMLWPARWHSAIPAMIVLRLTLTVAILRAWHETWYLVQRLRTEVVKPTASHMAYAQADPRGLDIPGVYSFHTDPDAPAPLPDPEPELRRILQRNRGHAVRTYGDPPAVAVGNGAGDGETLDLDVATTAELVAFPVKLFGRGNTGALNAQTWAARVLADESRYSGRAAVKDKLITDWSSRQLFDWMQRNAYADPPDAMHRRALTGRGRRLLRSVARGEFSPF